MSDVATPIRPVTSTDVARVAGVSRATVSRILNGDDGSFTESTRRRVREAAAKLSYRPSGAARSLVTGQNDTIVILASDTHFGGHLQDSVDEMVARTHPYGGNVVVRVAGKESRTTLDALLTLRPFVVLNFGVLGPAEARTLIDRGIIVIPQATASSDAPIVDPGIAALQGDVLREHGERPVWYAVSADEPPGPYSDHRFTALKEYCRERGIEPPRILPVALDVAGGTWGVKHALAHQDRAAIACYNDDVALTLLAGARELGVAVPAELAVVGVDDTLAGRLWAPRLTTIHVDMRKYIAILVEELRVQLEGVPAVSQPPLSSLFTLVRGETA